MIRILKAYLSTSTSLSFNSATKWYFKTSSTCDYELDLR